MTTPKKKLARKKKLSKKSSEDTKRLIYETKYYPLDLGIYVFLDTSDLEGENLIRWNNALIYGVWASVDLGGERKGPGSLEKRKIPNIKEGAEPKNKFDLAMYKKDMSEARDPKGLIMTQAKRMSICIDPFENEGDPVLLDLWREIPEDVYLKLEKHCEDSGSIASFRNNNRFKECDAVPIVDKSVYPYLTSIPVDHANEIPTAPPVYREISSQQQGSGNSIRTEAAQAVNTEWISISPDYQANVSSVGQ